MQQLAVHKAKLKLCLRFSIKKPAVGIEKSYGKTKFHFCDLNAMWRGIIDKWTPFQ